MMWTGLGFGVVMLMSVSVFAIHPFASDASTKPSSHALGAYNPTAFGGLPALRAASTDSGPAAVAKQRQRTPIAALRMGEQQNLDEAKLNDNLKSPRREFLGMSAAAGVAALTAASPAYAEEFKWPKGSKNSNTNYRVTDDIPIFKKYTEIAQNGVSFFAPKDKAKVKGKFTAEFGVTGYGLSPASAGLIKGTGHHHLIVDIGDQKFWPKGEAIPMDATHIHYGKGQNTGDLALEPGEHTLTLQFGDANHVSYGKEFAKTITVTVA